VSAEEYARQVLEQNGIPIHCITGVSAGAIVAAAYASGATPREIAEAGSAMRFTDVARWTIARMGIAGSERMERFLRKLLKCYSFEQMRIPLGGTGTDKDLGPHQRIVVRVPFQTMEDEAGSHGRRASRSAAAGPASSRIVPWPSIPRMTYATEIANTGASPGA
jgi:predicted acylesterase/phospholipase RssA